MINGPFYTQRGIHFTSDSAKTLTPFLADRTNGRATGTVLRLSVCRL